MVHDLREFFHFKEIDGHLLERLISDGQIIKKSYHKGMTVHEQHSDCKGIDLVGSGKLIAYSLSANGSETIVSEFSKGSIVGASLLFGDQNKYPMNIYCTEDSTCIKVSKEAVLRLLEEESFVLPFIRSLSMNSQGMNKKITMYTQKSLRENLMDYFMALSAEQKSEDILLPISKKQLADHFGVQRPSLFRELKNMKDEGLIEVDNRSIKILYKESSSKILGF